MKKLTIDFNGNHDDYRLFTGQLLKIGQPADVVDDAGKKTGYKRLVYQKWYIEWFYQDFIRLQKASCKQIKRDLSYTEFEQMMREELIEL